MSKKKVYGFRTPVRRTTNNVTGHKVGGDLSGAEVKIVLLNKLTLTGPAVYKFSLNTDDAVELFNKNVGVAAIGGYFRPDTDTKLTLSIELEGEKFSKQYTLVKGNTEKVGLEVEFKIDEIEPSTPVNITLEIEATKAIIEYTGFSYGFVSNPYLMDTETAHVQFFNSKKTICFPEQFYFDTEIELPDSTKGDPIILKSCNRCQRYLPINHPNERIQLAFSNHCTTKAPCTHGGFFNYEIVENAIGDKALAKWIKGSSYRIEDGRLKAHHGHQLECKACKKFFVNSALNHLRTSTQHREDALRRRAFELLIGKLLENEWIYHKFRGEKGKEFDKYIWEKFGKACFKCKEPIGSPRQMNLDHTMPLVFLYPLDETATCLCPSCNAEKSDIFPVDFYTADELKELSKITGINVRLLSSKVPNQKVIDELKGKLDWFFDEFLTFEEYTKVRDGKRAADSILHSLQKVINNCLTPYNLLEEHSKNKKA